MYKHPYFSMNSLKREVRDKNGKLLRITGNPYRLLELLCNRHPISLTITDINVAFDPAGAREYTEAHVRRMKNIIHAALGQGVIKYRNRVYSLIGELEKQNVRAGNTVLKKPFDMHRMKSVFVLKTGKRLRIQVETPGGGNLSYTNTKFEGTL